MAAPSNEFRFASRLLAPLEVVWSRVTTPDGINDELGPWLRMTMPRSFEDFGVRAPPLNTRLFRSWILAGGLVPIDYDDLTLVAYEARRGFHERSSMATARVWEHRRALDDAGDGECVLRDHLSFEPRFALAAPALRAIVPRVFAHRHRRLRARFGGEALSVV